MNQTRQHKWWPAVYKHARMCGQALGLWGVLHKIRVAVERVHLFKECLRAIRYGYELGAWTGLRTASAAAFAKGDVTVTLPGIRHQLTIRPHSSDRSVFEQIF